MLLFLYGFKILKVGVRSSGNIDKSLKKSGVV